MDDHSFYWVSTSEDRLDPGFRITLQHTLHFQGDMAEISPLVTLSVDALKKQREDNVLAEREAFTSLQNALKDWESIGAETMLLDKAIEYLEHQPLQHTANHWIEGKYGYHEISNMVYKLTWKITNHTFYDTNKRMVVTDEWYLSWGLRTNSPHPNSFTEVTGHLITGEDKKPFASLAELTAYLDARVVENACYFTEESPPVPKELVGHFSIGGKLLRGYTVEIWNAIEEQHPICLESLPERESVMDKIRGAKAAVKKEPLSERKQNIHDKSGPEL